jgi:probable addiction module antidote protein
MTVTLSLHSDADEFKILSYLMADGRIPFREWLQELKDRKAAAVIRERIDRLKVTTKRHQDSHEICPRLLETNVKKTAAAVPYEEGLYEDLQNPCDAALYLDAALKAGDPEGILTAMRHIAKARGMTKVAGTIKVHRVSLHRMLRNNGNPTFRTFLQLLGQFEIQLAASARRIAA